MSGMFTVQRPDPAWLTALNKNGWRAETRDIHLLLSTTSIALLSLGYTAVSLGILRALGKLTRRPAILIQLPLLAWIKLKDAPLGKRPDNAPEFWSQNPHYKPNTKAIDVINNWQSGKIRLLLKKHCNDFWKDFPNKDASLIARLRQQDAKTIADLRWDLLESVMNCGNQFIEHQVEEGNRVPPEHTLKIFFDKKSKAKARAALFYIRKRDFQLQGYSNRFPGTFDLIKAWGDPNDWKAETWDALCNDLPIPPRHSS